MEETTIRDEKPTETTPRISITSPDSSFLQCVLDYASSRQPAGSAEYTVEHMESRYDLSGSDIQKPVERMNVHEAFLRREAIAFYRLYGGESVEGYTAAADEIKRLEDGAEGSAAMIRTLCGEIKLLDRSVETLQKTNLKEVDNAKTRG